MDNSTKVQIVSQLKEYVITAGSMGKAAVSLGISKATVSNLVAGKWEKMSEGLFRTVESKTATPEFRGWQHAETKTYTVFTETFRDAQINQKVHIVTNFPGSGKTYTVERYKTLNEEVFFVKCTRLTTSRDFLTMLAKSMGLSNLEYGLSKMFDQIVTALRKMDNPLILVDEIEKTKGHDIFMLFIDLYNEVYRTAGIVLLGTPELEKRIKNRMDRIVGYNEVYSRGGGKVIAVVKTSKNDAKLVCKANGITDDERLMEIANDSQTDSGNYDLRRVEKLVHSDRLINQEGK